MAYEIFRAYKVEPPPGAGPSFTAVVLRNEGKGPMPVVSNRYGIWAAEILFELADLLMPEMEFNEWSVRKLDPATVEVPPEMLEQQVFGHLF